MRTLQRLSIVLLSIAWLATTHGLLAAEPVFRLATFSVDVTIPLGHRCMGILPTKSQKVLDPLYCHGFVLLGPDRPIVVCAVDWCEIRNEAYDQWRETLAAAAGTDRQRVLLSALHQHDAPVVDRGAARLLAAVGLPGELYDEEFHQQTLDRVSKAVHDALQFTVPVSHIGTGQAMVEGVASNRRVELPTGQVSFGRGSRSGADDFHRQAPVGEIDPWLRTLSFWNEDQPLLAMHAYATHPMSFYGRGEVSADFVGLARNQVQREDFSVKQIYVSGCSGDVTAGKYNDGSQQAREQLTHRMVDAMHAAWNNTSRVPLKQVAFRVQPVHFEFHPAAELTETALEAVLHDPAKSVEHRILAAMGLASRQRVAAGQAIDVPCVDFGVAQLVLQPGEAFVGYQLMAQRLRPDSFVMSVGYGECWTGYIPTQAAFEDGFADNWLWVAPGSQARLQAALEVLLR